MNDLKEKALIAFGVLAGLSVICAIATYFIVTFSLNLWITMIAFVIDFAVLIAIFTFVFTIIFYRRRLKQIEKEKSNTK